MKATILELNLDGMGQLLSRLGDLPRKVQRKVLRASVSKGCRVVVRAVKPEVPHKSGVLRKSIAFKVKGRDNSVTGRIGPRSDIVVTETKPGRKVRPKRASWYAHLVEHGTKPHKIPAGRGGKGSYMHPGSVANPFMARAWESSRAGSRVAIEDGLRQGIMENA